MKSSLIAALLVVLVAPVARAHGGGLDRNGCHTNRKTGEYHCHGSSTSRTPPPSSASPIRPATAQAVMQVAPTSRQNDLVRAAQVMLRALGYDATELGTLDDRTKAAIRQFQQDGNMSVNPVVTEYLVLRLAERIAAARCP